MELLNYFNFEAFIISLVLTMLTVYVVNKFGKCKTGNSKHSLVLIVACIWTIGAFFLYYNKEAAIADTVLQFFGTWFLVFLIYLEKSKELLRKIKGAVSRKLKLK